MEKVIDAWKKRRGKTIVIVSKSEGLITYLLFALLLNKHTGTTEAWFWKCLETGIVALAVVMQAAVTTLAMFQSSSLAIQCLLHAVHVSASALYSKVGIAAAW